MSKHAGRQTHATEDQLILHYYGEPQPVEITGHLERCETCRARAAKLHRELAPAGELAPPERGDDYTDRLWQRLQAALPRPHEAAPVTRSWWSLPRLAWGTTLAAALVTAFLLGQLNGNGHRSGSEASASPVRERILLVAVGEHLERTQRLLIELTNAGGNGDVDVSAEQGLADRLLLDNRLYRQTAANSGSGTVTELLDELERLLVELANGPERLDRESLGELQRRIERQGLLFKVRVIGTEARRQAQAAPPAGV